MTDQAPTETPAPTSTPSTAQDLANMLLRDLPAKRWFEISRALAMPAEDAMQDMLAILVIAANERNRQLQAEQAAAGHKVRVFDDFGRFLNMGFIELSEAAGLSDEAEAEDTDDESGDADPKSGSDDGLVADEGHVLSADGGPTV